MSNQDIVESAILNCRKESLGMPVKCLIVHPDFFQALFDEVLRNDANSIVMKAIRDGYYKGIPIFRSYDMYSGEVKAF